MAEEETRGRKPLKQDALVEHLVPDPAEVAPGTRLAGLLGKSSRAGHWRLYTNPSLTEYLEIADSDILSSYQVDATISPMGGSILTVRADAKVTRIRVKVTEARNAFLQGALARRYLPASRPSALRARNRPLLGIGPPGGGLGEHTDGAWGCWLSHIIECASHDPDDPICAGTTEVPGTADSCGMCSTEIFCPLP